MQDEVEPAGDVHVPRQVALDEPELRPFQQMLDVARPAGEEAVHADDLRTLLQQPLAQIGAEEPGAPGDQSPHDVTSKAASTTSDTSIFNRPGSTRSPCGSPVLPAHSGT